MTFEREQQSAEGPCSVEATACGTAGRRNLQVVTGSIAQSVMVVAPSSWPGALFGLWFFCARTDKPLPSLEQSAIVTSSITMATILWIGACGLYGAASNLSSVKLLARCVVAVFVFLIPFAMVLLTSAWSTRGTWALFAAFGVCCGTLVCLSAFVGRLLRPWAHSDPAIEYVREVSQRLRFGAAIVASALLVTLGILSLSRGRSHDQLSINTMVQRGIGPIPGRVAMVYYNNDGSVAGAVSSVGFAWPVPEVPGHDTRYWVFIHIPESAKYGVPGGQATLIRFEERGIWGYAPVSVQPFVVVRFDAESAKRIASEGLPSGLEELYRQHVSSGVLGDSSDATKWNSATLYDLGGAGEVHRVPSPK